MPAQQRVRCDDRGHLPEGTSAQPVCPSRESAPVVVGQAQASSTQLTPQHPILFQQIREGIALPTIQPAGKNEDEQLKGRRVEHRRSLDQAHASELQSAESWDTTAATVHEGWFTTASHRPAPLSWRSYTMLVLRVAPVPKGMRVLTDENMLGKCQLEAGGGVLRRRCTSLPKR